MLRESINRYEIKTKAGNTYYAVPTYAPILGCQKDVWPDGWLMRFPTLPWLLKLIE
jgi:hypothetical protein